MAAVLLGAVGLIQGCSDNSPTQPAPAPEYELQATAVIGPDGGRVGTTEFVLTVPQGAFDADHLLKVYGITSPTTLPAITHRFILEGLPLLYARVLNVAVLQSDSLQVNKAMTIGHRVWVPSVADTLFVSTAYPIVDSSGWLVTTLPATQISGASGRIGSGLLAADNNPAGLVFEGRSGYRALNSVDFDGGLPVGVVGVLTAGCLEAALDSLSALGFDYAADGVASVSDRINIGVETSWEADVPGYAYLPRVGDRRALMLRFDQDALSIGDLWCDKPVMPRLARNLCDLYAQVYDPSYGANSHLWLHKAVGLWAEYRYAANTGYLPPDFAGHARAVFDGMVWGADGPRAQVLGHGYGMAPMISYLVDHSEAAGDSTMLADVYTRILNHNDPTGALLVEAPAPVAEWWPDYLSQYVAGRIWPIYPAGGMDNDGYQQFFPGGDTTLVFSRGMRDMSARLYRIGLDRPNLGPTARVHFELKAPNISETQAMIVVFRNKNGNFEELVRGHTVTLDNVAFLNDNAYDLYALVTDARHVFPYTGLSTVTLTVTLAEPVDLNTITQGGIRVGGMRVNWEYSPDTCGAPPESSVGMWLYSGRPGSFDGNTFESSWSDTTSGVAGNVARNGGMTITVSGDQAQASFEISETVEDFDSGCTTIVHITGRDIPAQPPDVGVLEYVAANTIAAGKLTIESRTTCPDSGCDVVVKSLTYSSRAGVVIEFY